MITDEHDFFLFFINILTSFIDILKIIYIFASLKTGSTLKGAFCVYLNARSNTPPGRNKNARSSVTPGRNIKIVQEPAEPAAATKETDFYF